MMERQVMERQLHTGVEASGGWKGQALSAREKRAVERSSSLISAMRLLVPPAMAQHVGGTIKLAAVPLRNVNSL